MPFTREILAIIELCVYVPAFPLALLVVFRHGFKKQLGWVYLAILCAIRCAGAGFEIASHYNPNNTTYIEWGFILQSVGLSPLLMATMGLLKRITDQVTETQAPSSMAENGYGSYTGYVPRKQNIITKRATAISLRSRIIQVAQLPTMIALILCVVGGMDQESSTVSKHGTDHKDTKIGVGIFLVVYVVLFFLALITATDVKRAPKGEKRIYIAVIAALPLIALRLLYSCLATYTTLSQFAPGTGSLWFQLGMAVVEELLVVIMYTVIGLTVAR